MDSVLKPPEKHAYIRLCYDLNDTFLIFGHDLLNLQKYRSLLKGPSTAGL